MDRTPARDALERFGPWQRSAEILFWVLLVTINCAGNALTSWMDMRRAGLSSRQGWEPWVWEFSSGLMWLLVLVPAIVWFSRRMPLHLDTWRRRLPWYLLASVPMSVVHVLGMFGLRMLAYRWMGEHYDVGSWPREMFYEYLKDVRTFVLIVACIHAYRFVLRRLRGEVQLLAAPDEGPALDPVERPERLLVRKLGRDFLVATADIEWAQAAGNYVNLRVRGHDYPLRITMAALEEKLDPACFARVHRSWLINLGHLVSIKPMDGGEAQLQMDDGQVVPCSRRYLPAVRVLLEEGQPVVV
ncbi:LytTR family DNA-binding domain-containing protein [Stenotrophomonas sp. SY1]|uniref:LytTR family DNA-binding domain-containing protein n=1 Tax=Stenotrophomonas sp. SY1 TaxID=477235 RepID=UPI001E388E52|nr:LytTR family DNA-binding domain-containing protein [Stenotrophomonas sp. SY1]MCD9087216.1 LytTR family transcriptional regulator [Stenotrophomonas sp. SY1]